MDCKGKAEEQCLPPNCKWIVTKNGRKYCRKGRNTKGKKKDTSPGKSKKAKTKSKSHSQSGSKTKKSKKSFCGPQFEQGPHTPKGSPAKTKKNRSKCKQVEIFNDLADKCVKRDSLLGGLAEAKQLFTHRIRDPLKLKGPIQKNNNCWFNSVLVSLFLSDLGSKFSKDARHHMIFKAGKDGKQISNTHTRKAFKKLNQRIEGILDGKAEHTNDIVAQLHRGGYEMDEGDFGTPNEFIKELYPPFGLEKYYEEVYVWIERKTPVKAIIENNYRHQRVAAMQQGVSYHQPKPKQYAIYCYGELAGLLNKEKEFTIDGQKYKLDSIILHDTNKVHYTCAFTCNGKGYFYDGFGKKKKTVSTLNWMNMLNTNRNFQLSSYKFNFMTCAILMFYYAV
jgi:hypothetical protein